MTSPLTWDPLVPRPDCVRRVREGAPLAPRGREHAVVGRGAGDSMGRTIPTGSSVLVGVLDAASRAGVGVLRSVGRLGRAPISTSYRCRSCAPGRHSAHVRPTGSRRAAHRESHRGTTRGASSLAGLERQVLWRRPTFFPRGHRSRSTRSTALATPPPVITAVTSTSIRGSGDRPHGPSDAVSGLPTRLGPRRWRQHCESRRRIRSADCRHPLRERVRAPHAVVWIRAVRSATRRIGVTYVRSDLGLVGAGDAG